MTGMKIYAAPNAVLPRLWRDALETPIYRVQGSLVVVAATKKEAATLLGKARYAVKDLRVNTSTHTQKMIDAGVIDTDRPGVYCYYGTTRDKPIVEITDHGLPIVVAHFRYSEGVGIIVEPVRVDEPAPAGQDDGGLRFTDVELDLLVSALDKKIWSLDHVGTADSNPRKAAFKTLRARIAAELKAHGAALPPQAWEVRQ